MKKIIFIEIVILIIIVLILLVYSHLSAPAVYIYEFGPEYQEVQKELIHLGTKIITAYVPSDPRQTDNTPCYTAFGYICHLPNAIACPRYIPLGSRIMIDGNVYVCVDRLARKYDYRFDIAVPNVEQALAWGKQYKDVYLVK